MKHSLKWISTTKFIITKLYYLLNCEFYMIIIDVVSSRFLTSGSVINYIIILVLRNLPYALIVFMNILNYHAIYIYYGFWCRHPFCFNTNSVSCCWVDPRTLGDLSWNDKKKFNLNIVYIIGALVPFVESETADHQSFFGRYLAPPVFSTPNSIRFWVRKIHFE